MTSILMCCQTETTPFVITYNPALPSLAHIVHKHSNVLYSSDRCRNVFKNLPLVAYRRCKNISDILVRAQFTNSTDTSNSRPTPGSFRCNNRNCTTCPHMEHGLACSAGVFFERAICSRKRHVETFRREEEMEGVKGSGEGAGRESIFSPLPLAISFFHSIWPPYR